MIKSKALLIKFRTQLIRLRKTFGMLQLMKAFKLLRTKELQLLTELLLRVIRPMTKIILQLMQGTVTKLAIFKVIVTVMLLTLVLNNQVVEKINCHKLVTKHNTVQAQLQAWLVCWAVPDSVRSGIKQLLKPLQQIHNINKVQESVCNRSLGLIWFSACIISVN